jgi:sugar-phosphatase
LTDLSGYAAVLSDLDGTLVDSEAPVRRAWTAFARRQGLDAGEVVRFAQGRPAAETVRRLAPGAPQEAQRIADSELLDTDGVTALPGAAALLAAPLSLAIVTSCPRPLALARLRAAQLPVPETLICCDDVTHGKPDPECFTLGARRLSVDPADCVVLEDAPAGITAGRAAGMRVIAMRTTHSDDALLAAGATIVIDDPAALTWVHASADSAGLDGRISGRVHLPGR